MSQKGTRKGGRGKKRSYSSTKEGNTTVINNIESATNNTVKIKVSIPVNDLSELARHLLTLSSLVALDITNNKFNDIAPLAALTRLTELRLINNQINDVSPLATLTNLTHLSISGNPVVDVSSLSNLKLTQFLVNKYHGPCSMSWCGLHNCAHSRPATQKVVGAHELMLSAKLLRIKSKDEKLYLSNGSNINNNDLVRIVERLVEMPNIHTLWLAANPEVTDITPFLNVSSLKSISFTANGIMDISPLLNMTNLVSLDLSSNQIVDCSPLSHLTSLSNLRLEQNKITNATSLLALPHLTSLGLDDNVEGAHMLHLCAKLNASVFGKDIASTQLHLDGNMKESFAATDLPHVVERLSLFPNVVEVHLSRNHFSDISPLSTFTNFTSLHLYDNNIYDLAPLRFLKKLVMLDVSSNNIIDISPLQELIVLVTLDVTKNLIEDLTPICGLVHLQTLRMGANSIADISPLQTLENLTSLSIHCVGGRRHHRGNEQIIDFSPLKKLSKLSELNINQESIVSTNELRKELHFYQFRADLKSLATNELNSTRVEWCEKEITDDELVLLVNQLQSMPRLVSVDLSNNFISNVTPLGLLTQLTCLDLEGNQIVGVDSLSALINLEEIYLDGNSIPRSTRTKSSLPANIQRLLETMKEKKRTEGDY